MIKNIVKDICFKIRNIYQIITLKNKEISVISNNCIAGFLYQDYHLRFDSPTIGLQMLPSDYIKFCEKLEYYLSLEIVEVVDVTEKMIADFKKIGADRVSFPVGTVGDIVIYFQHYKSFIKAKQKWEERKQRIHYDNMHFVLMDVYCTREEIETFIALSIERKIVLSKNHEDMEKDIFYLKGLKESDLAWYAEIPKKITRKKFYEQFDFKKWFNEER